MSLRAAIVVLVMLNLGAAAWWLARPHVDAATRSQASPTDAPGLRLAGEAAPAVTASTAQAVLPAAAEAAPEEQAPAVAKPELCLRFGPFADEAARGAARAALAGAGVEARPRETPARSARGWKVAMPAFPSREEATAMAERLKAAGISDLYVLNQGEDANGIALGRFGSEDAARRREAELRAKGFAAQALPLDDTPPQAWLDANLPAGVDRGALVRIAPARPLDCAGQR